MLTHSLKLATSLFTSCPLCRAREFSPQYHLSRVEVSRCKSCGLMFLNPYVVPSAMASLYSDRQALVHHNPRLATYFEDLEGTKTEAFYDRCLDHLGKWFPKGPGSVLDVGCGNGFFLWRAQQKGWDAQGVDSSQENAQFAREHYGINIQVSEFESFQSREGFDCVTMWDYIEHVPHPLGILRKAQTLLRPGGILMVATPCNSSLINFLADIIYRGSFNSVATPLEILFVQEHILYFTPETLNRALEIAGFETLEQIKTGTDIDRFQTSPLFNLTAKVLLFLSQCLHWENRMIAFAKRVG